MIASRSLGAGAALALLALAMGARGQAQAPEDPDAPTAGEEPGPDDAAPQAPPAGEEPGPDDSARPGDEPYEPADAPSTGPRTECHGKRIEVVRVRGARRVAEDDVLATIRQRAGRRCDDAQLASDAQALWDLGFFDDLVFEAEPAGADAVELVITVVERPAIGTVTYVGNDEVSEEDLAEKVTLREGAVLSLPEVRRQVTRIRDLYAEKGFFLARVRHELVRRDDNEVEVRFVIEEGEEVTVRRLRFVGNHNFPTRELQDFMRTGQTGFWSFLSSSDTFNREHFDEDVVRVQALYYDRGYLTVDVGTPIVELTPDRHHIDLTIPITEGPRFRIGRLSVAEVDADGGEVELLGGRRAVRDLVRSTPGEWFSRTAIAESLQAVTRYYRDRGYARVDIVPQTDLHTERRTVDVVVQIQRGPLVRIERIQIRGNTKTRDEVIRREIPIFEGDLYSQTQIEAAKERIQALGYFERVDTSEEEGSSPEGIVVNVEVEERSTGTFQVGMGFSSLESFIFTLQLNQQNFLGNGHAVTLQGQISGIRQLIQARFVEPYLFGTDWTLAVEAFKTIRQFQDFNRDSTGGSLTLGHPVFDDRLRLFLQYRGDYVDISSRTGPIFGSASGAGFNIFRRLPLANLFRDGFTSSLRLSLTWDSRDNRLFPTKGIYASASTEVADEYVGSDNVFVRHSAFSRFYYPLFGGLVLKLNAEWGLINSRDPRGVPVFERFFLGGIFNVRGFGLNSLGPRLGLPLAIDPSARFDPEGVVFGGNMQLFYNLELEIPILESVGIRGVVFTDGGNTWNLERSLCAPEPTLADPTTDPCGVDLAALRASWGFGVRWISPLGPLRFEWGLPFSPRSYEQDILFEFTIGNFF